MSQPVLFLSPSCPCPGSPENPVGGFIGGHDCRHRCGVCPSVTIEAQTESARCSFGGFRQYDSPGAPVPPVWYKRSDYIRRYEYSPYSVSRVRRCSRTVMEQVGTRESEVCGTGAEIALSPYDDGCVLCTETLSNPGGHREVGGSYSEYGIVDGYPALVQSAPAANEPPPPSTWSGCDDNYTGTQYSLAAFRHVDATEGENGYLAPDLWVAANWSARHYRQAGDFGYLETTRYIHWPYCEREVLETVLLDSWSGTSEVTITEYEAYQLSNAWTEEEIIAAIPKATDVVSVAASGWQLRTGLSWEWINATCELVATGLVEGVTYEVKPIMRESSWVVNQPFVWSDVDVSWERFTASANDAANGRRIEGPELEPVRGMRTEVIGALIRIVEEGE